MRCIYLIILLTMTWMGSRGQSVSNPRTGEDFAFIEDATDTTDLRFIQTFKCISKKGDDLESLYRAINWRAKNLGANCFILRSFERDSLGVMTLVLSTYNATDSILGINYLNHEKNTVYLFGGDNTDNKEYTFNINHEQKSLLPGAYYREEIPVGGEVKISKGGSVVITWKEQSIAKYLTMSGFGLIDHGNPSYNRNTSDVTITFTTGKFRHMDNDFGRLLVKVLKRQE